MTKRRALLSATILAAGVVLIVAVVDLLPPRPGVTKANFNRIQKGMTRAEVEAIFGKPPEPHEPPPPGMGIYLAWENDDGDFAGVLFFDGMVDGHKNG